MSKKEVPQGFEQVVQQGAELEARAMEQARAAVDEGARLMKDGLTWAERMSAEWRKLVLEATAFGTRS